MTIKIVNYRAVREEIALLAKMCTEKNMMTAPPFAFVVIVATTAIDVIAPSGSDKADRRKAKADVWGAFLAGLGADVQLIQGFNLEERMLLAVRYTVENVLLPTLIGCECESILSSALPGMVAAGASSMDAAEA
jgi:hypothetical protein